MHVDLVGSFTPDMDGFAYTSLKPYMDDMQSQGATIVTIRGDGAGESGRSSKFKEELKRLGLKWESCGNICPGIYFVILHDSVLISRLSKNRDKRLSNGARMTF